VAARAGNRVMPSALHEKRRLPLKSGETKGAEAKPGLSGRTLFGGARCVAAT
jgi:hypothetical protein